MPAGPSSSEYKRMSAAQVGGAGPVIGGRRTSSIVNQVLLNESAPPLATTRLSVSGDGPQPKRVDIYTVAVDELGFFRKAIPSMSKGLAWLCLCFNILLPGFGTMISAFACLRGAKTSYKEDNKKAFCVNLLAAFLQLFTVPIIVGIIWSIMWGTSFVSQARED